MSDNSLCKKCIAKLVQNMSYEAKEIFKLIRDADEPLTKSDIEDRTTYSYSVALRRVDELRHKRLIGYREKGRAKLFRLTKTGKKLAKIQKRKGDK